MNSIKTTVKERMKKFRRFYYVYREWRKLRENRKKLWEEAVGKFEEEHPNHGNLADYKRALYRNRVSYEEYMKCYEFWRLDENHRDEFISEMEMRCIYRKTVQVSFDRLCCNKVLLYKQFEKYVHRKWHYSGSMSLETFQDFVSFSDCI